MRTKFQLVCRGCWEPLGRTHRTGCQLDAPGEGHFVKGVHVQMEEVKR